MTSLTSAGGGGGNIATDNIRVEAIIDGHLDTTNESDEGASAAGGGNCAGLSSEDTTRKSLRGVTAKNATTRSAAKRPKVAHSN